MRVDPNQVLSEEASLRAVRQGQDATNKEGRTPLWRACEGGLGECALFLIEMGCAPSSPALDGRTPLHMACLTGLEEVVKRMLALPEVDVDAIAANGQSPLHIALAQSRWHARGVRGAVTIAAWPRRC